MSKFRAISIYLLAMVSIAWFMPVCFGVNSSDASAATNQAELSLNSAYVATSKAQDAGADVESLVEDLQVAGNILSEARMAFRSGDYEAANLFAEECEKTIDGVVADARSLEISAERTRIDAFLFNAFWSAFGLILLSIFAVVGWMVLKRWYFEKVLEMKPEVEEPR